MAGAAIAAAAVCCWVVVGQIAQAEHRLTRRLNQFEVANDDALTAIEVRLAQLRRVLVPPVLRTWLAQEADDAERREEAGQVTPMPGQRPRRADG
ncbi:hypothetical protein JNUCC0626_19775 [Lentzea sp. JNUCC 0626]|uniref:hypothetical protein n=1 Tax=Lentzea sp. JNUCC 0626 TaxID=3367513 RepID=UPI00374A6612